MEERDTGNLLFGGEALQLLIAVHVAHGQLFGLCDNDSLLSLLI